MALKDNHVDDDEEITRNVIEESLWVVIFGMTFIFFKRFYGNVQIISLTLFGKEFEWVFHFYI